MKLHILTFAALIGLTACTNPENTVQIGENTFVHEEKVYRIIDNEITELGELDSDSIPKSAVLNPKLKDYGPYEMNYVKKGVSGNLTAVYRGDVLYFHVQLNGLNDLHNRYSRGSFTISLMDEFNFEIHKTVVDINEMTQILNDKHETMFFDYDGKTQMSSEIYKAITKYSVSSSLAEKGNYSW